MIGTVLFLIILAVSFFCLTNNEAREFKVEAAEQPNLLRSTEWAKYINNNGFPWPYDGKLTSDLRVFDNGYGLANEDMVYFRKKGKILSDSAILVRQAVTLEKGKYYQFTTTLETDSSDNDLKTTSFILTISGNIVRETVDKYISNRLSKPSDIKIVFKATESTVTVEPAFYALNQSLRDTQWLSVQMNKPTLVDITEEVLRIEDEVDALFTTKAQTSLKLSVTQKEITTLKDKLDSYKKVLDPTITSRVDTKLTNAQKILDQVVLKLTIEDLVNEHQDQHSRTIIGKTYPSSFIHFSGNPSIPEGSLSSGVPSDTTKYHIRADANGHFSYTLPDGNYFEYGETITINNSLHGKKLSLLKAVLDVIPPEQPILDGIKDTSRIFTGKAEGNSEIKLYEAAKDTLITSGKVGADGGFSMALPENSQTLVPYVRYYVTATDESGNVSEKSNIQSVVDTLPPEAEAVKQILNLGDALPETTSLFTNLKDNAGSENVTTTLTKYPDISKVGYSTAEVTLMDKAQNSTVIVIPIFVKDNQTVSDGKYMFYATDFSILTIDYPVQSLEQKTLLLQKSQAGLWDLSTGENKLLDIVIDDSLIKHEPGTYDVELRFDTMVKNIKVTFLPGSLAFEKIVESISFGTPTIQSKIQSIAPDKSIDLLINDTRFKRENWRLVAKLSQALQMDNGEKTGSTISLNTKNSDGEVIKQPLSEQMTTELYSNKAETNGKFPVKLNDKEGQELRLDVLPGSARSGKQYKTQIIWTLENGP